MNNIKINKIRKKLDILDNKLLNLIKKRTNLVSNILKQKKYKKQIIDKKRIKKILKDIRNKSIKKKNRSHHHLQDMELNDKSFY